MGNEAEAGPQIRQPVVLVDFFLIVNFFSKAHLQSNSFFLELSKKKERGWKKKLTKHRKCVLGREKAKSVVSLFKGNPSLARFPSQLKISVRLVSWLEVRLYLGTSERGLPGAIGADGRHCTLM